MNIEEVNKKRILDALYRKDLGLFTERAFYETNAGMQFDHNWHFDAIAHELKQVMDGKVRRLLITMPPRSLKSHSASVAFPAWMLGHKPAKKIVCVSYASDLAIELSNKTRKILEADWYKALFPAMRIDPRKDTEMEVRTVKGGYRLSATIGGSLTGRGGSIFIIDDPMKALDAMSDLARNKVNTWFNQTLMSRLDNKQNDAIIIVMQRLHVDDLAGHVLKQGGWQHLDLPAIALEKSTIQTGDNSVYEREIGELLHPSREPQHTLDEIKEVLGSAAFSSQYQQQPVPADGNMVNWKWFNRYTSLPEKTYSNKIVQSWDTASKSHELADYSACVTALVTKNDIYILDVFKDRLDYPELKKKIISMRKHWDVDTLLIEDKGSGTGLIADLKNDGIRSIDINPETDKVVRMSTCSAKIEDGSVLLPKDAHWMDDFKMELLAFPNGKHDDQVDAMSQLINWTRKRSRYTLDNVS
jgi:predicted phage terminase large subunit-like protein